jgi:hypothetical protein
MRAVSARFLSDDECVFAKRNGNLDTYERVFDLI